MKRTFTPHSRIRTPGLRPRCTAVHPKTGATCDKPALHSDRQSHRWSNRKTTKPPRKKFELRKAATELINDTRYRNRLLRDLRARKLKPSVEVMLWHHAVGKPPGSVTHTGTLSLADELRALTPDELRARALAIAGMLATHEEDEDDE